jgi:hypothetical protein
VCVCVCVCGTHSRRLTGLKLNNLAKLKILGYLAT